MGWSFGDLLNPITDAWHDIGKTFSKIPVVGDTVGKIWNLPWDAAFKTPFDAVSGQWQRLGDDARTLAGEGIAALPVVIAGMGMGAGTLAGSGGGVWSSLGGDVTSSTPWLLSEGSTTGAGVGLGEALTPSLLAGETASPALTYGSTGIGVGSGVGVGEGALAGTSALGGATAGAAASPLMYGDTGIGVGSGVGVGDVTPATLPEATVPMAPAESLPAASPVGAGGGDIYNFNAASENQPGGTVWPENNSMLGSAVDWMKNNKALTAMIGMNALGGLNKSSMAGDLNAAQQKSYSDYLNTINPPDSVKASRYQAGVGEVGKESSRLRKTVSDNLASRGIRGKGAAAPTGDVEELDRQARNKVYNQIYGTYNVPSTPGPANYAPTALQATMGDMQSISNYLLPFILAGKI